MNDRFEICVLLNLNQGIECVLTEFIFFLLFKKENVTALEGISNAKVKGRSQKFIRDINMFSNWT